MQRGESMHPQSGRPRLCVGGGGGLTARRRGLKYKKAS